jgi:hypothetical protein
MLKVTDDLRDLQNLFKAFRANAANLLVSSLTRLQKKIGDKGMFEGFTESLTFGFNRASIAYGQIFVIQTFLKRMEEIAHADTKEVFQKLL